MKQFLSLVFVFFICAIAYGQDKGIVAKTGDEVITEEDIKTFDDWQSAPGFKGNRQSRAQIIEGFIAERLIYLQAIEEGLAKRDDIKKRIEAQNRQIIVDTFVDEVIKPKIQVNDDEVSAYYELNKASFMVPVMYSYQMAKVAKKDTKNNPVDKSIAKCLVEKWREKNKWDMDAVIDLCLTDPNIIIEKFRPINITEKTKGIYQEVLAALKEMKINDVSDVIEVDKYFIVFKLTDAMGGGYRELPIVAERIKQILFLEKYKKAINDYVKELKGRYKVEVLEK